MIKKHSDLLNFQLELLTKMGQAQLKRGEQENCPDAFYLATLAQTDHTFSMLDKSFKTVNTVASDVT